MDCSISSPHICTVPVTVLLAGSPKEKTAKLIIQSDIQSTGGDALGYRVLQSQVIALKHVFILILNFSNLVVQIKFSIEFESKYC